MDKTLIDMQKIDFIISQSLEINKVLLESDKLMLLQKRQLIGALALLTASLFILAKDKDDDFSEFMTGAYRIAERVHNTGRRNTQ